jgi:hypothetical protein
VAVYVPLRGVQIRQNAYAKSAADDRDRPPRLRRPPGPLTSVAALDSGLLVRRRPGLHRARCKRPANGGVFRFLLPWWERAYLSSDRVKRGGLHPGEGFPHRRKRRYSILVLDGGNDAHVIGLPQVGGLKAGVADG